MVERVPCCGGTSNDLALTMLIVPHYWLLENQSIFTNESRNAMVLTYDFLIYSEVIRRDRAPFFPIYNFPIQKKKRKVQPVGSSLFLKYTTRTHSLSKKDQYTNHYT